MKFVILFCFVIIVGLKKFFVSLELLPFLFYNDHSWTCFTEYTFFHRRENTVTPPGTGCGVRERHEELARAFSPRSRDQDFQFDKLFWLTMFGNRGTDKMVLTGWEIPNRAGSFLGKCLYLHHCLAWNQRMQVMQVNVLAQEHKRCLLTQSHNSRTSLQSSGVVKIYLAFQYLFSFLKKSPLRETFRHPGCSRGPQFCLKVRAYRCALVTAWG